MNSNYVIHDPDNVPYNTFVIFRAIAIEISELSIKWNCDTLEEETKYDDCVDSTIKYVFLENILLEFKQQFLYNFQVYHSNYKYRIRCNNM